MRFQSIMMLTITCAGTCLAEGLAPSDQAYRPTMTGLKSRLNDPRPLSTATFATSSERFLRFDTVARDTAGNDEERVGPSWLSKVDDLMHKMVTSSLSAEEAQLKVWIQSQIHPRELFGVLSLGKRAAKLDDNPDFVQWLRLVKDFRANKGNQAFSDLDIYYLLLKTNSPEQLKLLFETLRHTPGMTKIGASMEKSLSGNWIRKALEQDTYPTIVYNTLRLKDAGTKLDDTPMFRQWLEYVEKYWNKNAGAFFGDTQMLTLFQKTMTEEEDIIKLVHMLRNNPGMKSHADKLERYLLLTSESSHKTMADVWLKARETPEEVFRILRLAEKQTAAADDNRMLNLWLRYTQTYRDKIDKNAFSDAEALQFFRKAKPLDFDWEIV